MLSFLILIFLIQDQEPIQGPLTDAIKQIQELRVTNKETKMEMSRLIDRVAASERERQTLFDRIKESGDALQEMQSEREGLIKRLSDSELRQGALSDRITRVNVERKSILDRLNEYREENGTLMERVKSSDGLLVVLSKRLIWVVTYVSIALFILLGAIGVMATLLYLLWGRVKDAIPIL